MWFAVLGPLEMWDDSGRSLPAPSGRLRALLAALLSGVNNVVSVDRLVDQVWNGDPPEAAHRNLQVYVHRLRAVLGTDRIVREHHGYRLVAAPDELDIRCFDRLADAAREARLRGDPREAARLYTRALAFWRGTVAYQDVPDFAELRTERQRLTELRLSVSESRFEADLARGESDSLVDELDTLVTEYPLREQFRIQLMIALYRAGRTKEALRSFEEFEGLLLDEHGMEPGQSLRRLAERIAEHDADLLSSTDAKPPEQLPETDTLLAGRDYVVESIIERMVPRMDDPTPNATVVSVAGPGGVGKSTVALRAAHSIAYAYPDGQLYANLLGATPGQEPMEPLTVLSGFLQALGQPAKLVPATLDEAAARFRSLTADRRILVVLDDAHDVAQVRPLLPGGGGPAVLITSRPALAALDDAETVPLEPLSTEPAMALLGGVIGAERVTAEPHAAAEIVEATAGLPLALRIVAARVAATGQSLESTVRDLTTGRDLLGALEHAELGVRASFEVSYRALSAEAAEVFDILGVLDLPDVSGQVIHAVLDDRPARVRRRVDELVEAQLVRPVPGASDRYTLHDLIRLYAQQKAAEHVDDERRETLIRRLLHSWIATARSARAVGLEGIPAEGIADDEIIAPGVEFDQASDAVAWMRAEAANLVALVRKVATLPTGDALAVASLPLALLRPMIGQSLAQQLIEVHRLAVRFVEGLLDEQHTHLLRRLHRGLIQGHLQLGNLDEVLRISYAEVEACERSGDNRALATAYQGIGLAYANMGGRHEEAREAYARALALQDECGSLTGKGSTMNNLGNLAMELDELDTALEHFGRAWEIAEEVGDWNLLAVLAGNLGEAQQKAGRHSKAVEMYQRAIDVARRWGYTRIELVRSWDLGTVLHLMGEHEQARMWWRDTLELAAEVGLIALERAESILSDPVPRMPRLLYRY